MRFSGDGLSRRATFEGSDIPISVDTKSASFELPTLLNIGISQDFYFDKKHYHKLTVAGSFTSNSFSNDQFQLGLQYGLKNIFQDSRGCRGG